MIQDIRLFTSQPKAAFYDTLFLHLDLSELEQQKKKVGRTGYPASAMLCAFVVMKCEGFGYITDLTDYLENNRLIAYYCGFDITKPPICMTAPVTTNVSTRKVKLPAVQSM